MTRLVLLIVLVLLGSLELAEPASDSPAYVVACVAFVVVCIWLAVSGISGRPRSLGDQADRLGRRRR